MVSTNIKEDFDILDLVGSNRYGPIFKAVSTANQQVY
jgi:hypothetical protein